MLLKLRKAMLGWASVVCALTLVVGCSALNITANSSKSGQNQKSAATGTLQSGNNGSAAPSSPSQHAGTSDSSVDKNGQARELHPDPTESLLGNMQIFAEQGKVLFCDFPAKTSTFEEIESAWGRADKTDYVAATGSTYASFTGHYVMFGVNKRGRVFEVRSYDPRFSGISLAEAERVLGKPAYDAKSKGQEVIGYAVNSEFKLEMVFGEPTASQPNPGLDHYNVLYPRGTVNTMANYSGRQW
ncbi:hypothetical protein CEB3_c31020 [Peptococcaceae bacterium CEB3]|nr:hypothetical protein CEB3_c31020 [Peptococcaceae bacterium CEB3]